MRPVFPNEDPLPCSQSQSAIGNRHSQSSLGEHAANMGGHIVWPLRIVLEQRIAIRNQTRHEAIHIA